MSPTDRPPESILPPPAFPDPPECLFDDSGAPKIGTYFGPIARVDLSPAVARLGRAEAFSRHKRWFYTAVSTDELWLGAAIVDTGYAANAFAYVSSHERGVLATTSHLGVPGLGCRVGDLPEEGADARFRSLDAHLRLRRREGSSAYELVVDSKELQAWATIETARAPWPLTAIARPLGGEVNVTEKRALCDVRGEVRFRGERHVLDGGLAGMDYTQGLLPRMTAWRWAYMLGRTDAGLRVALNLVEGFNGGVECGVWVGRRLYAVGEGRFEFDRNNPDKPWRVTTACGAVDLRFESVGVHAERRDLLLIRSEFVQPVGRFFGAVRVGDREVEIDGVPGVVEDQSVRW
ncbi:MAG: DUF2804 domain-containing protein [Polyangiaceae bacterium]|nr:DUF2804 domain-containing protein [Polyangiaceae bacterium]